MDEDDVYGLTDDYVVDPEAREALDFELHSDEDAEPTPRQATAPDMVSSLVSASAVLSAAIRELMLCHWCCCAVHNQPMTMSEQFR